MGPRAAILTCFLKALSSKGRAGRAEYWWFLPVGLVLPGLTWFVLRALYPDLDATYALALCLPALAPLVSVTARRLNDVGERTDSIGAPFSALVVFLIFAALGTALGNWVTALLGPGGLDAPVGFFFIMVMAPILFVVWGIALVSFLFGIFTGASLFGHMFLPSEGEAVVTGSAKDQARYRERRTREDANA